MTIALRNGQSVRGTRIDSTERKKKVAIKKKPTSGFSSQEIRSILYLVDHDIEVSAAVDEVISWRS